MNSTDPFASYAQLDKTLAAGIELKPGDRVRLQPRGRADAIDMLLRGKTAVISAIEQDFENRVHLAVTIDDDPGRDMGSDGRPGHRFYFGVDEVEIVDPRNPPESPAPRNPASQPHE